MEPKKTIEEKIMEVYNEIKKDFGIEIQEMNNSIKEINQLNTSKARLSLYYTTRVLKLVWSDRKKIIEHYKKVYKDLKKIEKDLKKNYGQHLDNPESLEKEIKKDLKKAKKIIEDLEKISSDIGMLKIDIREYESKLNTHPIHILKEDPLFQRIKTIIVEDIKLDNERLQLRRIVKTLEESEKYKEYKLEKQSLIYINNLFKNILELIKKLEEIANLDKLEELEKRYNEAYKKLIKIEKELTK